MSQLPKNRWLDFELEKGNGSRWCYHSSFMIVTKNELPFICSWGNPFNNLNCPKIMGGKYKFPCLLPGVTSLEFHIDDYLYNERGTLTVIENLTSGEQNIIFSIDLFGIEFDIDGGVVSEKMIFDESLDELYEFLTSDPIFSIRTGVSGMGCMWKFYKVISMLQREEIIPNITYIGTIPYLQDRQNYRCILGSNSPLKNPEIREFMEVVIQTLEQSPNLKITNNGQGGDFYLDYGGYQLKSNLEGHMGSGGYYTLLHLPTILEHLLKGDIVVFSDDVLNIFNHLHPLSMNAIVYALTRFKGIKMDYPRLIAHIPNWLVDRGQLTSHMYTSRQFLEAYNERKV